MNNLKTIRERLGVTQQAVADALCCTQGNVGHIEKNLQEMKPPMAQRLIAFGQTLGHSLTFDDVYGELRNDTRTPSATAAAEAAEATAS